MTDKPSREPRDWDRRYITGDTPWSTEGPARELVRLLDELAITADSIASGRVLDLGCGAGSNALHLAELGFAVTGVDIAPTAVERARARARRAGVKAEFLAADLLDHAALASLSPFPLVVDRGTYHVLRDVDLDGFLTTLARLTEPGSLYLVMTGNANDPNDRPVGPPAVHAHELTRELAPLFDLVQLREFLWDVEIEGSPHPPWGWSAVHRRKPRIRPDAPPA